MRVSVNERSPGKKGHTYLHARISKKILSYSQYSDELSVEYVGINHANICAVLAYNGEY